MNLAYMCISDGDIIHVKEEPNVSDEEEQNIRKQVKDLEERFTRVKKSKGVVKKKSKGGVRKNVVLRKRYQCDVCDYSTERKHHLASHQETHLDSTICCDLCDYKYGSFYVINMHQSV